MQHYVNNIGLFQRILNTTVNTLSVNKAYYDYDLQKNSNVMHINAHVLVHNKEWEVTKSHN